MLLVDQMGEALNHQKEKEPVSCTMAECKNDYSIRSLRPAGYGCGVHEAHVSPASRSSIGLSQQKKRQISVSEIAPAWPIPLTCAAGRPAQGSIVSDICVHINALL
jgi:hypothetical protein